MENLNKVVSFALGLVVVVVFLAIISGKIDLRKKITGSSSVKPASSGFSLFGLKPSPTPTLTPTPTKVPVTATTYNQYNSQKPKTIPATGSPTILIPVLLSSLVGGLYLKKKN